jgi:hypothetical protein
MSGEDSKAYAWGHELYNVENIKWGKEVWAHDVHSIASKLIEGGKLGICMDPWCVYCMAKM